ncbi:MAG: DUF2497 domain-containing protein [Hyphomicrobiales bacterium]
MSAGAQQRREPPRLRGIERAPGENRITPPARPLIAPLTPQLSGSMRDLKVSVEPSPASQTSGRASKTEDFLALRSRIADLSATRERLARISAGGPSSFASVLGGYVRPDDALSRRQRRPAEVQGAPPPPPASALRGSVSEPPVVNWQAARSRPPAKAAEPTPPVFPPLNLPPIERAPLDLAPERDDDVDDSYIEHGPADPGAAEYAAEEDFDFEEPEVDHDEPLPVEYQPPPTLREGLSREARAMLSQDVADATASAFDRLADTIVTQASGGSRSIEDLTRELLRPMLKAWLDQNLPSVVERLVREEIDRVARRSGR